MEEPTWRDVEEFFSVSGDRAVFLARFLLLLGLAGVNEEDLGNISPERVSEIARIIKS